MMLKELDRAVLEVDLPEHGLKAGDIGTIVLDHSGRGFEVEFLTLDGETLAVVSLASDQVRPVRSGEIAQARLVESR
jgi:uncharacterized protein DUF4926